MRIISGIARGTKLYTLDGINTRPTLDRVKESLFNILGSKLKDSIVLDLFAGSGALGLEAISRGSKKAILCDNSQDAINIIQKNIEKMRFNEKVVLLQCDYKRAIKKISEEKIKLDILFLDPPYKTDLIKKSLEIINNFNILNDDANIILETDEPDRIKKQIADIGFKIYDIRKYGRVSLIFLEC